MKWTVDSFKSFILPLIPEDAQKFLFIKVENPQGLKELLTSSQAELDEFLCDHEIRSCSFLGDRLVVRFDR